MSDADREYIDTRDVGVFKPADADPPLFLSVVELQGTTYPSFANYVLGAQHVFDDS
jgi:hypothetical protein